jgi:hypothetical protein
MLPAHALAERWRGAREGKGRVNGPPTTVLRIPHGADKAQRGNVRGKPPNQRLLAVKYAAMRTFAVLQYAT